MPVYPGGNDAVLLMYTTDIARNNAGDTTEAIQQARIAIDGNTASRCDMQPT